MSPNPSFIFFVTIPLFLQLLTTPCNSHRLKYRCQQPKHNSFPFCNTSLSTKTRAKSLISLLTLDEKIQQLANTAAAIPRLGIPSYEWWSEALHGVASTGDGDPGVSFNGTVKSTTGFPQVILSAATFNRSLWSEIAAAVAVEARAMYNAGQAGLTFWAPNVNIFRDPRWGRGQETPGEDPRVVADYAVEYVRAFQRGNWKSDFGEERRVLLRDDDDDNAGDDDKLVVSACCKHFIAYDLEKWGEITRYNFNAVVTGQDMADTYQPPFKSCTQQGKASCLMCSYTSINGVPSCANRDLLQKARTEWNFRGYIASDCDAVSTIYEYQNYTKSPEDAVAVALKAGMDLNCGHYMLQYTKSAVEMGKVLEEDIDRALLNLFSVQIRLGLFDGDPAKNRLGELGPQDVCSLEHRKLALEAAKQGIVLLKNEKKFLPLDKHGVSSLAVIGPLANSTDLGGGYTGVQCNPISILEGLQEYIPNIYHAKGCEDVDCNSSAYIAEAISAAKQADHVVVVVGLDLSQETENHDRYTLLLPGYQMELVKAISVVTKKPLVLVLTGGGPIDVSFAVGDPHIGSIVWVGYPGEAGGRALSEIIFGDYNPGGRLPMTWYPESFTSVPMGDMNMRADHSRNYPGRTYRFYTGEKIYGFGYGLSYTNFKYNLLSAPSNINFRGFIKSRPQRSMLSQKGKELEYIYVNEVQNCVSLNFEVHISVTNNGNMDGSEVVLLFSKYSGLFKGSPERQLIGFDRVGILLPYESRETSIVVDPCEHLSFADEDGNKILPIGDHILISENIEHIVSIET